MMDARTSSFEAPIGARRRRRSRARALLLSGTTRNGGVAIATTEPAAIEERPASSQAAERRDARYRRALCVADLVSAALALGLCVTVGNGQVRTTAILLLPLVVIVSKLKGLYDRDELLVRKNTLDELPQLFQSATLYTLVLWLLDSALIEGSLSNAQVVVLWVTLFGLGAASRHLARGIARRTSAVERCLFIGDARAYDRVASKFASHDVGAELVGRMSLQRATSRGERPASEEDLRALIDWTGAHRVIIEPQALPPEDMLDFVRAAKSAGVGVSLLPRVLDVVGTSIVTDDLHGVTVLGVRRFGLTRSSQFVKRSFDLVGAGVGLLIVSPLMLAFALAIKLDSSGPVLFRQTRVGRDGRHFRICKFRTMVPDAENQKAGLAALNECTDGLFKMAEDPRITRVGKLLRKTSLDELPQLFNVLFGDMSLVGPRPLVVDEDCRITGWDRRRLSLTPGMTGHWQILGSARVPMHEMVKIDYLYAAGWTLWVDVKILLRTVPFMLSRRGL